MGPTAGVYTHLTISEQPATTSHPPDDQEEEQGESVNETCQLAIVTVSIYSF